MKKSFETNEGLLTIRLDFRPSSGLIYGDRNEPGEQPAWWVLRLWPLTLSFSEDEGIDT